MFHCLRVWDALCDGLVRSLVLTSGSLRLSYPSSVTPATPESKYKRHIVDVGDMRHVSALWVPRLTLPAFSLESTSILKSSRSHFVNAGVAFMDRTMKHNVWIVNNPPFKATPSFFHLSVQFPESCISLTVHLKVSQLQSFCVFFNKRTMPHPLNWETLKNILISWKIKRICKTNIGFKFCLWT